jgi:hypothetical protein
MTQAAGKPTCYQVGGWKTTKQVEDDMNQTTQDELEKLAINIKMTQDLLGKHMGSNLDANAIHRCEREGKGFAFFLAKELASKALEEEECLGCETGCDAESAHTFSAGCCLADDIEARRPPAFVPMPSPICEGDRMRARDFLPMSSGDKIVVEVEETTDEEEEDSELEEEGDEDEEEEDSEWEEEEGEGEEEEDSEWEEEGDEDEEDEDLSNSIHLGITESSRLSRKRKRFADESRHLPAGWGGSAGSNNGYTKGRGVDMGHTT